MAVSKSPFGDSFTSAAAAAATYIGAVVGAGFASGKEIYLFFTSLGAASRPGIVVSAFLFVLAGGALLDLSRILKRDDIEGLLGATLGGIGVRLLTPAMMAFIYGALAIMLAGGGSLSHTGASLDRDIGTIITATIVCIIVLNGSRGILLSNLVIVPVMAAVMLYTATTVLIHPEMSGPDMTGVGWMYEGHWICSIWAPVIYTSYNLLLVMGMLAAIGNRIPGSRSAYFSATAGGVGIGLLLGIINEAMLRSPDAIADSEIPMLAMAALRGRGVQLAYQIAVYMAMITSATSAAYTIGKRLGPIVNSSPSRVGAWITVLAVPLARRGFTTLLTHIYPLAGYIGIPMLSAIIIRYLTVKLAPRAGMSPRNKHR